MAHDPAYRLIEPPAQGLDLMAAPLGRARTVLEADKEAFFARKKINRGFGAVRLAENLLQHPI